MDFLIGIDLFCMQSFVVVGEGVPYYKEFAIRRFSIDFLPKNKLQRYTIATIISLCKILTHAHTEKMAKLFGWTCYPGM